MDDIFTPTDTDQETPEEQSPLETLVGEGKKFATPEDLAKGKLASDRFIEQLQNEMAELRQEVSKQMTIDEILTQIRASNTQEAPTEPRNGDTPQEPSGNEDSPKFSNEAIAELVQKQMSSYEEQKRAEKNEELVASRLKALGADAQIHLNKKAKELNVSLDYLRSVAKENPTAFFKLVDLGEASKGTPPVAPQSRVNVPSTPSGRDKKYYDRLKAEDRKAYFSAETQRMMYKDMEKVLREGGTWE